MAASEWQAGPMVQMILARRDVEGVAGDKNPIGSLGPEVLAPESVLRSFNVSYTRALFCNRAIVKAEGETPSQASLRIEDRQILIFL
jgi:hypothetical protein